jgi:hypothetical protein
MEWTENRIDLVHTIINSPANESRSRGSAQTSTALSWLIAWVRDLAADALASLNKRTISTGPSPVLALAVAWPESTARAAASASMVSVLPRRRAPDLVRFGVRELRTMVGVAAGQRVAAG